MCDFVSTNCWNHTVAIKIEKWFFVWDSSNDCFSGKKRIFSQKFILFSNENKTQPRTFGISFGLRKTTLKKKSPFPTSHRCNHFGASPIRFTIQIKYILFYVCFSLHSISSTQMNLLSKMPSNCSFDSFFSFILSFIFDYLRFPVENTPWMSKARQSLTVLWSPILYFPVCSCAFYF